jgi:hypothetical protein
MDAETLAGARDMTEGFALEKRRMFHRGSLVEPYLGELCPLRWDVGLGRPMTSPRMPMTSSSIMDVLGRQLWQWWHVWDLGEAQGGLMFCSRRLILP